MNIDYAMLPLCQIRIIIMTCWSFLFQNFIKAWRWKLMDLLLSGEFEVRLLQFLHAQLILKSAFPWHERLNINERRVRRGIYFVINKNVLLSFQYEYSNKIGPILLILMHLYCFIVCCVKIAAIYGLLVCSIFGPQILYIFDKFLWLCEPPNCVQIIDIYEELLHAIFFCWLTMIAWKQGNCFVIFFLFRAQTSN